MLLTTTCFAQNSATIAQTGSTNSASALQGGSNLTATVSQTGTITNTLSNTGVANQTGTGHNATVNQNGGSTFTRAYITQQNGTSGPGSNSAILSQSNGSGGTIARGGDPAVNTTAGAGNWSGVFQTGNTNRSRISQDDAGTQGNFGETVQQGTNNLAVTNQSQGAKNNSAQVFQGYDTEIPVTRLDVVGNEAFITQDGSMGNQAKVKQFTDGNTASVLQTLTTTGNSAYIQQGQLGALVSIPGGNTASVQQTDVSLGNSASVIQTSTNSIASILQLYGASQNEAHISQIEGTNHNANIQQGGDGSLNKAIIKQTGSADLIAIIYQVGDPSQTSGLTSSQNVATITQGDPGNTSFNNRAFIGQAFGATSNTATIDQNRGAVTGSNNAAQIEQGLGAINNMATISQAGSNNVAGVRQTNPNSTTGNTASFAQTGDNNLITGPATLNPLAPPIGITGLASQDGSGNSMLVSQTSLVGGAFGNTATLNQTGNMNSLTVNQTLNTSALSGNVVTADQTGMNNQVIVQQTAMP